MLPSPRRASISVLSVGFLLSCSDGGGPTDPVSEDVTVTIQVQRTDKLAEKARLGADRGKATLEDATTGGSLGAATVSIDTTAAVWTIPVSLPRESAGNTVVPVIELINLSSRPEWSGKGKDFEPEQGDPPPVEVFPGPPENLEVTGVTITSEAPTILEGDSVGLEATVEGGGEGTAVVWSSLDEELASVDRDSGMVRGVFPGVTSVEAAAGEHADTLEVTVEARVAAVEVTPGADTLGVIGDTLRFSARAVDPRDDEIGGVEFVWSSSDGAVAEVDETGLVTSRGFGAVRITASVEAIEGGADLTVEEPILPEGVTRQWVGGAPADPTEWGVADNWYPSGVPTEADTVLVGAEAVHQPQVTGTQTQRVGGVIVAEGATVELVYQALEVTGYVQADGAITGSTLTIVGAGATFAGNAEIVRVEHTMSLSGDATIDLMRIRFGSVTVGAHTLSMGRLLVPSGSLVMDDPASVVTVTDSMDVRGGDHTLTAGRLEISGSLYVDSDYPGPVQASGTHLTVFNGAGHQTVNMGCRRADGSNTLQDMEISNTSDSLTVSTAACAAGDLAITTPVRVVGAGLWAGEDLSTLAGSEIATNEVRLAGPSGTQFIEGTLAPTTLILTGTDQTLTGGANTSYTDVRVHGSVALGSDVYLAGELSFDLGSLVVGPHALSAARILVPSGSLVMDDPASVVTVTDSMDVRGGNHTLTAGRLEIAGGLYLKSLSVQASGTHLTVFNGTGHQTVHVSCSTASGDANTLQDVEISNASDSLTVGTACAAGDLAITTPVRVVGGGLWAGEDLSTVSGSEIATDEARLGGPSGTQLVEGTLAPTKLVLTGTDQILTDEVHTSYTDVEIRGGSVTFSTDVSVAGNLSVAGSLSCTCGTWNVTLNTTTTIQGDLTLSSGVTLNNDGTVEYGGTFIDSGATINGDAPQPISP